MALSERVQRSLEAQRAIDARLDEMKTASASLATPMGGWIFTIRSALGMSIGDLATRLAVLPSTVKRLEQSEQSGTINFESLQKAAEALDCELVYALVPKTSIERQRLERARKIAIENLDRVQETMGLENQSLSKSEMEQLLSYEVQALLSSSRFWKLSS